MHRVDAVIEVHDARIPLSGRNSLLHHRITTRAPHILCMNKADLVRRISCGYE